MTKIYVSSTRKESLVGRKCGLKRLCFFIDKGNADSFFEQLVKLNEFVKQEWVSQGNYAELYERIGSRVLVILDNASFHKRQEVVLQKMVG